MKPIVTILLTHKVLDKSTGHHTSIVAVFSAQLPTNVAPDIGHSVWLNIWEDKHPYELKVIAVNHHLSKKKVWQQEVVVEAELEGPQEAPDDGTIDELVQNEKDEIIQIFTPRLLDQGFRMVVAPNTDHQIGNPRKRAAALP